MVATTGLPVTTAVGPRGSTKLVYLGESGVLSTKLGLFPIAAAGGEVR